MPKIDPFKKKRLRGVSETNTFTDPNWPEDQITLTLESKPGTATQLNIATYAGELEERFLAKNAMEVFIGVDDDKAAARITPEICQVIATIQTLDVTPTADRYQFEDWVAIAELYPTAFAEIVLWAQRMLGKTDRDDVPNGCAAATEPPSLPQQISDTSATLKWSEGGTPLIARPSGADGSSAELSLELPPTLVSTPDTQPPTSQTT